MKSKRLVLAAAGFAMPLVVAAGAAGAEQQQTNDAAVIANAKVTMAQAITAAEHQTGGTAVGSGIEDQNGTVFLEVQLAKDNQTQKAPVDPQTGKVVKIVSNDQEDRSGSETGIESESSED